MADFGARMKRAREERGISLRQIANSTKISVSQLEWLERNDISRLPGGIFSRAFVRSYAAEIGLDPEETVREFLMQFPHDSVTAGSPHVPQEDHAAIESSRQSAQTALKLFAVSLPVAGLILYLTLTRGQPAPAPEEIPEPPPAPAALQSFPTTEPAAPSPAETPLPAARAPVTEALPVGAEPITFEIVANGPVSMDVTVDGVRRQSHTATAGERVVVRADREMTLTLSDAGAVQLTINSQPAVALGAAGEQRTVQISRENLSAFLASQ